MITEGYKEKEESVLLTPVIITAIGFIFLMFFVVLLVAPYLGWSYKYDASVSKIVIEIPKAKKYSINIRRKRVGLLSGQFNLSHGFPIVSFWITKEDTNEAIPYTSAFTWMRSKSGRIVTTRVGFFEAPNPGKYFIESKPESQFVEKDEIMIRRYVSTMKQVLLIIGICICGFIFIQGVLMLLERV